MGIMKVGKKAIAISYPEMLKSVYEKAIIYIEGRGAICMASDDGNPPDSSRGYGLDGCQVGLGYQENHGSRGSIHLIVYDDDSSKVDRTFNDLERTILKLKKKAK